tara:strand:+ start:731 stop:2113 length:1383 start_codon:yes stop_codon:yes gene_type:complete
MSDSPTSYQHIVYLGAGESAEMDALVATTEQLTLVESQPLRAEKLRKRGKGNDSIRVIEQCVAGSEREVVFTEYNLPWAAGINLPPTLQALYPGLKTLKKRTLSTVAINELINSCALEPKQKNMLVIDLLGQEEELLTGLDPDQLHRFKEIVFVTGKASIFDDVIESITQHLQSHLPGFKPNDQITIPQGRLLPWQQTVAFQLDPAALQIIELQQQLTAARVQIAEVTQQRDQQKAAREAADRTKTEQQALADTLTQQLQASEAAKAELTKQRDQATQVRDQLQTQLKQASSTKIQLEKQRDELTTQRDQASQARDQLKGQLELRISELSHTLAETHENTDQLTRKLTEEQQSAAQLSGKVHQLKAELDHKAASYEANRQDMAIALRMQAVRDADLKELQQRYAKVLSIKDAQEALLRKLTERLSNAANYLQKTETASDNISSPQALVGELMEAFSGAAD